MAYAATAVARKLLEYANSEERSLTPLELVKLTYLSHGWHLAFIGKPLVSEDVQAWQYGPVYPSLYHAVKHYRASPVADVPAAGTETFGKKAMDDAAQRVIESVYDAYRRFNGVQLSALTHQKGTPWEQTWDGSKNKTIPNDVIQTHFDDLRRQRAA